MPRQALDLSVRLTADDFRNLPAFKQIENVDSEQDVAEAPVLAEVHREPYVASDALVEALNMAAALGRPLLLQGEPGCGKTQLAHAVAFILGLPLEEAYIKSTSRAHDLLYTFDAVRQLYDVQRSELHAPGTYVRYGPLGRAIARAAHGRRSVVLLDEIDKADLDFPNDLLWELDRLEFRVAETPGRRFAVPRPELRPLVMVTHNEEKPLPTAFLRRCVFFHIEFPSDPAFLRTLLKEHGRDATLGARAIEVLLQVRKLDLTKRPGLSELLDWVGYLDAVKTPVDKLGELPHLGLLLKQQVDQQVARRELASAASKKERS
ncbi:MoxR-like ATPase [Minicystis rosea]|nr:MoxR-like ATPase [Minicystis rosea]